MGKKELKLYKIIEKYAGWEDNVADEKEINEAKEAIKRFYFELKKIKPNKNHINKGGPRSLYLIHLYAVHKAFNEKKYKRVCNELTNCVEYGILQGRYYYNVLNIIKRGLNIDG